MAAKEEWRAIPGWDHYEASSKGRIRRRDGGRYGGRVLSQRGRRGGYLAVTMRPSVHQLVAAAFHGRRDVGFVPNHKNGNKKDNVPSNLEWLTPSENAVHAFDTGLQGRGEKHGRAKLSDEQVTAIRRRYTGAWGEQGRLAKEYGVSQGLISQLLRGDIWGHLPLGEVRAASGKPVHGAAHPQATVTDDIVRSLRQRYATGGSTYAALAKDFGISVVTVSRIIRYKTWKHVT